MVNKCQTILYLLEKVVVRLLLCFLLISCTEADVIRCPDNAYLYITPDCPEYTLPALKYHFYNMDGRTEHLCLSGDGKGNFEGKLPAGVYRVVAVNPDAGNVEFRGMDSYETAIVSAKVSTSRNAVAYSGDYTLYAQPSAVYVVRMGNFTVLPNDTLHFTPPSALLTRRVNIRFILSSGSLQSDVSGIEGIIRGVYPAVYLYDGRPVQSMAANNAVNYVADNSSGKWYATVDVFGLYDPDYGNTYSNVLEMILTMSDGSQLVGKADLTEQLSEIIAQTSGEIPVELELELEIKIDTGFTVTILPWEPGGDIGWKE